MKKDLIFAPILLVIGILLCLFKLTGTTLHIIVSVVGIAVLVAYTVHTKKEWKNTPLEIAMRVAYGVALISGIVIKISWVLAVAIIHKLFAVLFVVLLIIIFILKLVKTQQK